MKSQKQKVKTSVNTSGSQEMGKAYPSWAELTGQAPSENSFFSQRAPETLCAALIVLGVVGWAVSASAPSVVQLTPANRPGVVALPNVIHPLLVNEF